MTDGEGSSEEYAGLRADAARTEHQSEDQMGFK